MTDLRLAAACSCGFAFVCATLAAAANEESLARKRSGEKEKRRDLSVCFVACDLLCPITSSSTREQAADIIWPFTPEKPRSHSPSSAQLSSALSVYLSVYLSLISKQNKVSKSPTQDQNKSTSQQSKPASQQAQQQLVAFPQSKQANKPSTLHELFEMNTCAVQDVASLQAADHVCIWDKTRWPFRYTHHGIVFETGKSGDAIVIAHVWSRIDSFRASQADSSFQLTSLTEFLNGRPVSDMRRVQYNSSLVGNALSKLGEVHRAKSDIPPIVLARCNFLLGLGRGHFSILSLNCEHVALWCKTGVVWSKQLFHKVNTKAPFLPSKYSNLLRDLDATVEKLRQEHRKRNQELKRLDGKHVYLQLGETKFVKRLGDELYAVYNDPKEKDPAFRHQPTPFILQVDIVAYNCVKVVLQDALTGDFMCSKAKSLKMLVKRSFHRESMFKFEFVWNGELQSRRHRRWYIGAQTRDGLLRTFNTRDHAATFQIVDAAFIDSLSVEIDPTAFAAVAAGEEGDENPVEDDDDSEEEETAVKEVSMVAAEMAALELKQQQQQQCEAVKA